MPIRECFQKYKLILFDMDGVITSEDTYFTAAVLAAYELLHPGEGESAWEIQQKRGEIRRLYLQDEKINARLKELAVNTNWDLAYLLYMMAFSYGKRFGTQEEMFSFIHAEFCNMRDEAPKLYETCARIFSRETGYPLEDALRQKRLWKELQDCFQAWYLGDIDYEKQYGKKPRGLLGKPGLIPYEKPIVPMPGLISLLDSFQDAGIKLGVGTGRPRLEIEKTLDIFGLTDRFAPEAFITYSEIAEAERELFAQGIEEDLSKPHPYIFLKGALGKSFGNLKIMRGEYDKALLSDVLVVGDAGSDAISAKRAGLDFAAVLTGVTGIAGAHYFRKIGADYILDSVLDFMQDSDKAPEMLC